MQTPGLDRRNISTYGREGEDTLGNSTNLIQIPGCSGSRKFIILTQSWDARSFDSSVNRELWKVRRSPLVCCPSTALCRDWALWKTSVYHISYTSTTTTTITTARQDRGRWTITTTFAVKTHVSRWWLSQERTAAVWTKLSSASQTLHFLHPSTSGARRV